MSKLSDFGAKVKKFFTDSIFAAGAKSLVSKRRKRTLRRKMKRAAAKKLPEYELNADPILQELTQQLIDETVGPYGEITQTLRSRLQAYDKDETPLDVETAEKMLLEAVKAAVSRRKLLNERLVECIEFGELYHVYYERIQAMSSAAVDASEKMELMHDAEKQYHYYAEMFRQTRNNKYGDKFGENVDDFEEIMQRERDVYKEIFEEGI